MLWFAGQASVQAGLQPSPRALLKQTSHRMVAALDANRALLARKPTHIYAIVEQVLVPHVDMNRASRWALGRHWREASAGQRVRFEREFHTLLVRFYSTALVEYLNAGHEIPDGVIAFLPPRGGTEADARARGEVTVRTVVRPTNGRAVPVNYEMRRGQDGWKVCDVTVDGVSIITAYRSVFNTEIRKHGIDGLIETLAAFNQRYAVRD
ncbi:MAG TPA: ABC transporter substrate-binding protein [Alphaproteobacteria bacterium]|nr:ABC transporter substrate-binding protein [Alphaproteobacteria bacterium]